MEGRGKRILDFLLLKPAFTGRNLFSIFLVMMFVGVYIASGGRVYTIPKIKPGGQFGAVQQDSEVETRATLPSAKELQNSIFGGQEQDNIADVERGKAVDKEERTSNQMSPAQRLQKLREQLNQKKQQ